MILLVPIVSRATDDDHFGPIALLANYPYLEIFSGDFLEVVQYSCTGVWHVASYGENYYATWPRGVQGRGLLVTR